MEFFTPAVSERTTPAGASSAMGSTRRGRVGAGPRQSRGGLDRAADEGELLVDQWLFEDRWLSRSSRMPSSPLHALVDQLAELEDVPPVQQVLTAMGSVPDPRHRRGVRHPIAGIL